MIANITRRIQLLDVTTARQNGEQDAQALLASMGELITSADQQDDASAILMHSLHPIIELAQQHRIEECMARLEGFAGVIGPVLERSSVSAAAQSLIGASPFAGPGNTITQEEQRAVNAAISTCSRVSAGRILAAHQHDDDAIVTLCELQLAVRALEPKFTES